MKYRIQHRDTGSTGTARPALLLGMPGAMVEFDDGLYCWCPWHRLIVVL